MGAAPIGRPGWPDFACCTASAARNRIVLTQSWSRSRSVMVTISSPRSCAASGGRRAGGAGRDRRGSGRAARDPPGSAGRVPAGAASRDGMRPSASLARTAAPRLEPSASADGVRATPEHIGHDPAPRRRGQERGAGAHDLPEPGAGVAQPLVDHGEAVRHGLERPRGRCRGAASRATGPRSAARAPAAHPRLRSPARNGSIVSPCASGSIASSASSSCSSRRQGEGPGEPRVEAPAVRQGAAQEQPAAVHAIAPEAVGDRHRVRREADAHRARRPDHQRRARPPSCSRPPRWSTRRRQAPASTGCAPAAGQRAANSGRSPRKG